MPETSGPEWTLHLKGDGVPPTVVQYSVELPWKLRDVQTVWIVTSLDCHGRSMQKSQRWWRYGFGKIFPGRISYFDGCGVMVDRVTGSIGVFKDLRTIRQMLDGCCPPQLMVEILGTEGIPS